MKNGVHQTMQPFFFELKTSSTENTIFNHMLSNSL
jgi:hypothetical protein